MLSRREVLGYAGVAGGTLLYGPWTFALETVASGTRWERRAQSKKEAAHGITWLTHEPMQFLLRRGDHDADLQAEYERMLAPENIRSMAAVGVRYGRIFFYKGFGLEYERDNIAKAKTVADQMHGLGMKVSLYFGGTMFVETFYRETPEAIDWEQRDEKGRWVPYGAQTYRHYACPNEPRYREYLKRILKIGIVELKADEIAFDNIMLQAEPRSCRCHRCIAAFAEFLQRRYPTREASLRRFGVPDPAMIQVNQWETDEQPQAMMVIDDPVLQEWTRFRCESLARYSADLFDCVKSLNKDVACLFNIKGVYSINRYWTNAVYQPLFNGKIDLMAFDTGGYDEHIDPQTGALVSQIRSYKLARRLGTSCEDAFSNDVRAAVHMAFGYQKPGCVAAPLGSGAFNQFTPLLEFFREYNDRYYVGTDSVADVAVLRNWPSMAFSMNGTYVPTTLMEQVLIQYKVPFDLLFDEMLTGLERYQAVILAGQECVSDAQAALLLHYVRVGGTLILAGRVGVYNEWRERRTVKVFPNAGQLGSGRILTIAEIVPGTKSQTAAGSDYEDPEPGATVHRGVQMTPSQWVLPRDHEEIYRTIATGLPAGMSVMTEAPLTTVMELLERAETRETILHLVNFERRKRVEPFAVQMRRKGRPTRSVILLSPEFEEKAALKFEAKGDVISFMVPGMATYAMIVVA